MKPVKKMRGVNLGSWLVLEKWMVPSLFEGTAATDETTWCAELGPAAAEKLRAHWNSWITESDFAWLAARGINTVRIPLGHWIFGADYPYHPKYEPYLHPFVTGGINILDRAFDWAEAHGIDIMLDLHAAAGCQNGFDNGGMHGVCEWHTKPEYFDHSISVLERLAARYNGRKALIAIEVLNEPRWDVPTDYLKRYNEAAYHAIRQHCAAEKVAVVFHDGFRDFREYLGFMQAPEFQNVIFDIHRYQCFAREDIDMDIYGHIQKAAIEWKNEADAINSELKLPTICGEWSLGLDLKVVSLWAEGPYNHALQQMDGFQEHTAFRAYAAAQLMAFEKYRGWFFWNYKTETTAAWSLRASVENGWLPAHFDGERVTRDGE
ncbi:MAG: glycoside hydrolase family 5 protein [Pseudomonadales bacterium]|jgi:glucan 1,3-beta-glucosidase|nr:glycoside hydrolase family 5 protein [Pseudomonadales bacterium]